MAAKRSRAAPAGRPGFVQTMVEVWRRPALTSLEIAWRWSVGVLLFFASGFATRIQTPNIADHSYLLRDTTLQQPLQLLEGLFAVGADILTGTWPLLRWFAPLAAVVWVLGATLGRTLWLRRLDPALKTRMPTIALLTLLKLSKLAATLGTWAGCWVLALRVAVRAPLMRGEEPNLVLLAALMIGMTLLLFVAWSVTSWIVQLATLIAMARNVSVRKSIVMAIRAPKALRCGL